MLQAEGKEPGEKAVKDIRAGEEIIDRGGWSRKETVFPSVLGMLNNFQGRKDPLII